MTISTTRTIIDGLGWPECPRWHEGSLWFTDMYQKMVFQVVDTGTAQPVCEVDDIPGGHIGSSSCPRPPLNLVC